MEFFHTKTNIDFYGIQKWTAVFSVLIFLVCFASIGIRGLNWGLDFTGGYAVEVHYTEAPDLDQVRERLETIGIHESSVITFGSTEDIMIRFMPEEATDSDKLKQAIITSLGDQAHLENMSYVGPEVGEELAEQGFLAMLIAVLATMAYIAFRFETKFAFSAAIALAFDPVLILGCFSFFDITFDLTTLAAILAVIGYSLNDTVVVYDRVRENFLSMRKASVIEVVNRAINDTLSRTIMTSGLTLIVVVVLFFMGGPSIHGFSLALIIGVLIGTYSSIYVAGSLAVLMGLDRNSFLTVVEGDAT